MDGDPDLSQQRRENRDTRCTVSWAALPAEACTGGPFRQQTLARRAFPAKGPTGKCRLCSEAGNFRARTPQAPIMATDIPIELDLSGFPFWLIRARRTRLPPANSYPL